MNTSQYSYALLQLIMVRELCNSSICNNIFYIKIPFSKKGLHINVEAGFQSLKSTIAETGMGVTSRP